jgi:Ribbon-helix-helix protein, copG family
VTSMHDVSMRTTVTLDPDLAAKLRALARERGVSFKEALNSTLRRGLTSGGGRSERRYKLASRRLGLRPGVDLEQALRLAGELEDGETIRKLEPRK